MRWDSRSKLSRTVTALLLCLPLAGAACAHLPQPAEPFATWRAVAHVQGEWLSVRLSRPAAASPQMPLVLFITGDGGWRGKDLDAFNHLIGWGYPVVGVSAPEYLRHLDGVQIPPQVLADDIATIIAVGDQGLHLPASIPVLLVGVSRGADLVVVAAARRSLRTSVRGVLAVALTKEEEYVRRFRRRITAPADTSSNDNDNDSEDVPVARPYVALRRVAAPVCVIQSTNDQYVRAADARQLFGPDTDARQFHAIESRDHSFSDARDQLYDSMRTSLQWINTQSGRRTGP
jgi:pimeloyl-ACP methyl ester carboxylesterase